MATPKDYFKLHKRILKFFGLSFNGNESCTYKLYSFFILTVMIFAFSILDTYELFKHDFATSSGIVVYQTASIIAVVKAISVMANRKNLAKVLAKLEQEPFLPDPNRGGEEEERLIGECIWNTTLQTYVYLVLTAGSIAVYSLYAIITRLRSSDYHNWRLMYGPLTVLDITHSPNYEITMLYQSLCIFSYSIIFVTIDLIIAGVLAHISYQFKVLQNFLRNIVEYSRKEMLKDLRNTLQDETNVTTNESNNVKIHWKYLQKSIKEAVQYHSAIFELATEMEESFRYMLLTTFLVIMAVLCFEIYQTSYQNTERGMIRHIIEYMDCSLQVVTICYWGDEILSQSEGVGSAAYESNFVGSDLRFQKALVMIIRRSQIPTKLTAGKFANICLDTCVWVWTKSYSLFTLLRNTN